MNETNIIGAKLRLEGREFTVLMYPVTAEGDWWRDCDDGDISHYLVEECEGGETVSVDVLALSDVPSPGKADYANLEALLAKRGWTGVHVDEWQDFDHIDEAAAYTEVDT